jgi:hypothetical protein
MHRQENSNIHHARRKGLPNDLGDSTARKNESYFRHDIHRRSGFEQTRGGVLEDVVLYAIIGNVVWSSNLLVFDAVHEVADGDCGPTECWYVDMGRLFVGFFSWSMNEYHLHLQLC